MYYIVILMKKNRLEIKYMLCSICNKKNTAVVFVNKPSSDGNNKLEGLLL